MTQSAPSFEEEPRILSPGRKIHPLESLLAHKFLALAIMVLVAAAGLPLAWIKGSPLYYTEGVIQISPVFMRNLKEDSEVEFQSNSQYRQYVQQQVRTVNRWDIVWESLDILQEKGIEWQLPSESRSRATQRLQAELSVRAVPDTYLIAVGLSGETPDGLQVIVNTVIDCFLRKAKEEEIYGKDLRVRSLEEEKQELLVQIPPKLQRRSEIAQSLSVTTFSSSFLNPYDQLLITAKESLGSATRARIQAEAEVRAVDPETPQGKAALRAMALELVSRDPGLNSLKSNLNLRRATLLEKMSGLTAEHLGRQAILRELSEIDAEVLQQDDRLLGSFSEMILEQKRARLAETERVELNLTTEVKRQTELASAFALQYQEALELGLEVDQLRSRLNSIDDRISFFSLESAAPGFARVASPARPPEIPVKGGRRNLFLLVCAAAFGLGIVAPQAIDFIDPRIRVPADLEKVLRTPILGWVVDRKGEKAQRTAIDQIIRLAAAFERERRVEGSRIFGLTGVSSGDGVTQLSLDVAQALQRIGVNPLVVEVNPGNPDPIYGKDRPSLGKAIRDNLDLCDSIVPAQDTYPARIALGEVDPWDRLGLVQHLKESLKVLQKGFDILILDLAPVLESATTELLLEVCDEATLIVRAGSINRDRIRRSASKLEKVESGVVAFVLNRINIRDLA